MTSWLSSVEKMKRWMVMPAAAGAEAKLLCVVCLVPRPGDPPVQGDYVEQRVQHSIKRLGYACIALKDFDKLKMTHGVDWNEKHSVIFQHKKKNAYALLYSGDLPSAAKNAMKNSFGMKISKLVDINYHSFSGKSDVKILTIKGAKPDGRHLSCDFVDVHHAESMLSSCKMSHCAGGYTARVEPSTDEV